MKKIYILALSAMMTMGFTSCNDFLDYKPTAVVDEDKAFSDPEKMVNSAYAMLGDCWYSYPFNLWPYGDLSSDDCLKGGGGTGDTGYHDIEIWSSLTSTRGELDELWYRLYCAVSRCNRALVALEDNGESSLGTETTKEREAEVRFLRAHFYFKLISVFRQVPWIDEQVYRDKATEKVSNTELTYEQLFQKVIDDFISTKELPERVDDFFVESITALLKGFEPVVIDAETLVEKLEQLQPLSEDNFRKRLNDIIASYTKGKDESKLRIVVKRKEN